MNVLVLHFTHPEGYPPTLNAINCISCKVDKLIVLSNDTLPTKNKYDKNVELILLKGNHDKFEYEHRSKFDKLKTYLTYTYKIFKILKNERIDLLIIYDDVPFFFYMIASFFLKKKYKLWYHNHDVYPLSSFKKYKINWLGSASVQKYFSEIDYFSLPAVERKKMFPLDGFKGKFFYIPNYPSKRLISSPTASDFKIDENYLKLIYPGNPSHKNGFEELVDVMDAKINGKTITLTIVGDAHSNYQKELTAYAKSKGVEKQLFFVKRIPYIEMTHFLKNYHIGWALYKPVDLSVATAGSSSNKIYEFLANGLPIIVYDNEHHKTHLHNCKAAFYSDLSKSSILEQLQHIDKNLHQLSKLAQLEFETNYQFEIKFNEAFDEILKDIHTTNITSN